MMKARWMIPLGILVVSASWTAVSTAARGPRVVHHDVEWYANNTDQRNAVKRWCAADTRNAQLSATDCANAVRADKLVMARSMGVAR